MISYPAIMTEEIIIIFLCEKIPFSFYLEVTTELPTN